MFYQLLATENGAENFLLSDGWLLMQNYLIPFLTLLALVLVNYVFGAIAISGMMKRYGIRNSAYAWIPVVRYYYVGKLAYATKTEKGNSAMGIVVPILAFISTAYSLIYDGYACLGAYSTNAEYPISSFYDEGNLYWFENFESLFLPSGLGTLDLFMTIVSLALLVCSAFLFYAFFRRFKIRKAGWFTAFSIILGLDGVFFFAVRNNQTTEEVFANGGFRPQTPFGNYYPYGQQGNPYGNSNPYGQQGNPYGNSNPYGQQGNPYGNSNPYGQQGNPYGQPFNPYGAPQQPQNNGPFDAPADPYSGNSNANGNSTQSSPFSDLEGSSAQTPQQPQSPQQQTSSDPFSEFESNDKGKN